VSRRKDKEPHKLGQGTTVIYSK